MFFELPQSSIKGWISNHQGRVQETREAKDRASCCCHRLAQVTPQNLSFRIPFFFFGGTLPLAGSWFLDQ